MKSKKKATTKKQAVLVNFILDRSGSMSSCAADVVGGFNRYIAELRKDKKTTYAMTLTQFDDVIETLYKAKPLAEVGDLSSQTFVPRGSTALLDAVGKTINAVKAAVPEKAAVLTVVFTDGGENASREFSSDALKNLIAEQEKGSWTFVFLGANQDSWAVASQYGFQRGNVMKYQTTATASTMTALAGHTTRYSHGMRAMAASGQRKLRSASFFKPQPKR